MGKPLDTLIVGGGMITNDLILPSIYHLQRTGTVGRIDVLVNNAAYFRGMMSKQGFRRFNEWSTEDWDYTMDVNLRGMWFCAQAVYPYMQPFSYGKIINVSSATVWEGVPGFIHYVSSKGGIIAFSRTAAGRRSSFWRKYQRPPT